MDLMEKLKQTLSKGLLPEKEKALFLQFCSNYEKAIKKQGITTCNIESILFSFLEQLQKQILSPSLFEPYHKKIRTPFDYYQFGLDFINPLIEKESSTLSGHAYLEEIEKKLQNGENVIFLANHQIEADPQAISVLLEERYPKLAEELIFVAGERVVIDPLAIPFSLGRNLLCIYSKRYIDHPPELKTKKQLHNRSTMELMSRLLSEGGSAIYVAPSGGRDRQNSLGVVEVAPFDPQSIEMFYLMTKKASKPTSFYPMALYTYNLLPPPRTVQKEIGEEREVNHSPIHLWIGPQIAMESFPGSEESDKKKRRELRAKFIENEIKTAYAQFPI